MDFTSENKKPQFGVKETKVEEGQNTPSVTQEAEDLTAEYTDNRSVTIAIASTYSAFRKINLATLGKKKETIGSSISSSRALSANKEEVDAYFPNIIGISPSHPDFVDRVKSYLNNIQMTVTEDGKTLDISFIYKHKSDYLALAAEENAINEKFDTSDKSSIQNIRKALDIKLRSLNILESKRHKYGYPINVEEYLMYRHCLVYRDVAKDLALIGDDANIRFYIKDEVKEKQRQAKWLKEKNVAKRNYVEMIGDDKKFNAILIEYCVQQGINVTETLIKDRTEQEIILDKFSSENPDKFNKMFSDRNLLTKAFVNSLIVKGELVKSEYSQNISTSNGEFIGANLNEAVAYFNNPDNANIRASYENKLKLI